MEETKEYIYSDSDKAMHVCEPVTEQDVIDSWQQFHVNISAATGGAVAPDPNVCSGSNKISTAGTTGSTGASWIVTTPIPGNTTTHSATHYILSTANTTEPNDKHIPGLDLLASLVKISANTGDKGYYHMIGDDKQQYDVHDVITAAIRDLQFFHSKSKKFPHAK